MSSDIARLRRQPGYGMFWATATVTRLADEMMSVGVVLLVLERTGSAALAGATVAAVTLPSIVTGPLLGAWLDRSSSRRGLMMLDQVLAATSLVGIALLAGNGPDLLLPLIALMAGITWPLSFGGFTSLIPVIVPDELLGQANALEASSFNAAVIGGPALAGTISGIWGPEASLLTEAAVTLAVIPLIARIGAMNRASLRPPRPLREIVRDGLGHLIRTPPLRGVSVAGALNLGGIGLMTVAFPFFAVDDLGAHRSAAGYLWTAFALGSAIGALGLVRLNRRWPPERIMMVAITCVGCTMLLWPLATSLPAAMALIMLTGIVDGPGLAATFGARQRWTPPELLGQIFTTAVSMKVGAFSLGAAIAGPAVIALGARGTIVLGACFQFAAVGSGIALGALRGGTPGGAPKGTPKGRDITPPGSDLEQDDGVDDHRDRERDRPPVQVALDERSAAERA